MDQPPPVSSRRWVFLAGWIALTLLLAVLALGAVPVGIFRGMIEDRITASLGTQVTIRSITRDTPFSYTPVVSIRDVRIRQPAWAGPGDFVALRSASARVPLWQLLLGSFRPDRIAIDGLRVALVRDMQGRENWRQDHQSEGGNGRSTLSNLIITDARFSLRDDKRGLVVAGPVSIDAQRGLRIVATGTFLGTPARLEATGGRIAGVEPGAPYPFAATLTSPALYVSARGVMAGALNTERFSAAITAKAPTLKNADRIIEAGLFASQPVDLAAAVRHEGRDWFIDRIGGAMGRSRFTGRATVLKRDGRTAVTAAIAASQFDFEDLSDDAGRAAAARRQAQVGDRLIPFTRMDLSKLGKTDGKIDVAVTRLLSRPQTIVRTLKATLVLDHRLLTITGIEAGLAPRGRIIGTAAVDHRTGKPKLAIDLRIEGTTLEALIGKADAVEGPARARILLSGSGDTVREALAGADGKAALVATSGSVKTIVADVLGQNLGGAVTHAIAQPGGRVPLQCLIASFRAQGGVMTADPIAIQTGTSIGRGTGRILLDGETIALTLTGSARSQSGLRIVDPIKVGGTLSDPSISIAGIGAGERPSAKGALKVFGRSVKAALGIGQDADAAELPLLAPINCDARAVKALR